MKYFFEKFSEVESPQSGSTLDNTRLVCANVDKLIVVLKLFFVYPSRRVQRVKTKHRLRFDSGKRAVETKPEIGTVYSGRHRNYKLVEYGCTKCEVRRAHREVMELFLSKGEAKHRKHTPKNCLVRSPFR